MAGGKWTSVGIGVAVSAALTLLFFGMAKLLVTPIAGQNAVNYRQQSGLEPPVGEWFIENANMYADSIPLNWMIIFGVYWFLIALLGKGSILHSKTSLTLLALALSLNFYFVLNAIFGWYYWSCFEEPYTHRGFDVQLILECPSREVLLSSLVLAPLGLAFAAGVAAVFHSRRRFNED